MVRSPLSTLIILIVILSLPLSACTPGDPLNRGEPTQPPKGDPTSAAASADPFQKERLEMVDRQIAGRGIEDPRLLEALRQVPRHAFVPEEYRGQSYADHPLPIGYGQTISQPYVVALMTELLEIDPGERVLEVGTGSGYQAAVLAEMDAEVYTVEIIPELARRAEQDLQEQGYGQVQVKNADGYFGWKEYAPYEKIIVTAAPDHLPQPLIQQLDENGKLVIPIGPIGAVQTLWLFQKVEGELESLNLGPVKFVPLTGEH